MWFMTSTSTIASDGLVMPPMTIPVLVIDRCMWHYQHGPGLGSRNEFGEALTHLGQGRGKDHEDGHGRDPKRKQGKGEDAGNAWTRLTTNELRVASFVHRFHRDFIQDCISKSHGSMVKHDET